MTRILPLVHHTNTLNDRVALLPSEDNLTVDDDEDDDSAPDVH